MAITRHGQCGGPRMPYGAFSGKASGPTGPGRIEFTIPRSTLEFAVTYQPLEFTLPKTVEEFGVETP